MPRDLNLRDADAHAAGPLRLHSVALQIERLWSCRSLTRTRPPENHVAYALSSRSIADLLVLNS